MRAYLFFDLGANFMRLLTFIETHSIDLKQCFGKYILNLKQSEISFSKFFFIIELEIIVRKKSRLAECCVSI